jgi:hypothetical protein
MVSRRTGVYYIHYKEGRLIEFFLFSVETASKHVVEEKRETWIQVTERGRRGKQRLETTGYRKL